MPKPETFSSDTVFLTPAGSNVDIDILAPGSNVDDDAFDIMSWFITNELQNMEDCRNAPCAASDAIAVRNIPETVHRRSKPPRLRIMSEAWEAGQQMAADVVSDWGGAQALKSHARTMVPRSNTSMSLPILCFVHRCGS